MTRYYVNLNLRVADRDPKVLARHFRDHTPPELGLDPLLMDAKTPGWHRELAARLHDAGLPRTLHLPFFDLQPGSADARIRAASRDRLLAAMETAAIYAPDRMVGHAAYNRLLYRRSFADWAERAADTWAEVLAAWPEHPPLCLENTYETDPATVTGTVEALRQRLPEDRRQAVGICFDIGHWHSFAEGVVRQNLDVWIEAIAPYLLHMHLHDNDGTFDQHLGPGQGDIPFDTLFTLLGRKDLRPTVTFEPHTSDAYAAALCFAAGRPEFFAD